MDNYESLGSIGEGTYGVVLKARHKESGQIVAIKRFKESDEDDQVRKTALREVRILKQLKHDHIVNLIEVFRRKGKLFLVFEYVDKTILEELEGSPYGLDEIDVKKFTYQLLRGVQYCHSNDIIHRDIKPENILVSKSGVLKLCDFGFARTLAGTGAKYTDYVATRWYRAPELLVGDTEYSKPVDIWAIGCNVAELSNGIPLFPGESDIDQLFHIIRCFGKVTDRHVEVFKKNPLYGGIELPRPCRLETIEGRFQQPKQRYLLGILHACLHFDPDRRHTCDSLLQSSFFTDNNFITWYEDELRGILEREANPLVVRRKKSRRSRSEQRSMGMHGTTTSTSSTSTALNTTTTVSEMESTSSQLISTEATSRSSSAFDNTTEEEHSNHNSTGPHSVSTVSGNFGNMSNVNRTPPPGYNYNNTHSVHSTPQQQPTTEHGVGVGDLYGLMDGEKQLVGPNNMNMENIDELRQKLESQGGGRHHQNTIQTKQGTPLTLNNSTHSQHSQHGGSPWQQPLPFGKQQQHQQHQQQQEHFGVQSTHNSNNTSSTATPPGGSQNQNVNGKPAGQWTPQQYPQQQQQQQQIGTPVGMQTPPQQQPTHSTQGTPSGMPPKQGSSIAQNLFGNHFSHQQNEFGQSQDMSKIQMLTEDGSDEHLPNLKNVTPQLSIPMVAFPHIPDSGTHYITQGTGHSRPKPDLLNGGTTFPTLGLDGATNTLLKYGTGSKKKAKKHDKTPSYNTGQPKFGSMGKHNPSALKSIVMGGNPVTPAGPGSSFVNSQEPSSIGPPYHGITGSRPPLGPVSSSSGNMPPTFDHAPDTSTNGVGSGMNMHNAPSALPPPSREGRKPF